MPLSCAIATNVRTSVLSTLKQTYSHFLQPAYTKLVEHFALEGDEARPLTAEGRVTMTIFRLNDEEGVIERERLIARGLYGVT